MAVVWRTVCGEMRLSRKFDIVGFAAATAKAIDAERLVVGCKAAHEHRPVAWWFTPPAGRWIATPTAAVSFTT